MIVYMVTNQVNGKEYIGQTVQGLEKRKYRHMSDAKARRDSIYFHSALRKYGPDNFDWEVLHECDNIEDLNKLEIYYIGYYDTFENGYNLTFGGRGSVGYIPSAETRLKLSVVNKGRKHSEESKKKMSESAKGKKHSDETKRKLSTLNSGKNHPHYGKRGKNSPNAVPVIINNKYFDTRKEAAKFIGISPAAVRRRILHKTSWLDYSYA